MLSRCEGSLSRLQERRDVQLGAKFNLPQASYYAHRPKTRG